jgi:hypothetical protein
VGTALTHLSTAGQFEWDTLEYELEEEIQDIFKNSEKTVRSMKEDGTPNEEAHVHPVTGAG